MWTPGLRLGAISFVNTIPIYAPLAEEASVQLYYEAPATLNALMRAGELDVSPVSSACYLRHQEQFVLLDDLSVSSPGAVESVLFLSRCPWGADLLTLPAIRIPNDSETSVMLLAYLLQEVTGFDVRSRFQLYEASDCENVLAESDNALIIGDNALLMKQKLEASPAESFYCYDLSSLWKQATGLPFVFAVWVANRRWAEQYPDALKAINATLVQARQRFFADDVVFEAGLQRAKQKSQLPTRTLERYFRQCLNYHLDEAHQASLARFEQIIHAAQSWKPLPRERVTSPLSNG